MSRSFRVYAVVNEVGNRYGLNERQRQALTTLATGRADAGAWSEAFVEELRAFGPVPSIRDDFLARLELAGLR